MSPGRYGFPPPAASPGRGASHAGGSGGLRLTPDSVSAAVALGGIVAFMIALLATLRDALTAVYASSDVAMAPYLSQRWLTAPAGARLLMGHAPFYAGLWIFRLLHLCSAHRLAWELAPWVLSVAASLAVGRAIHHVAGRAAALLVCAALICTGTQLLPLQFAWGIHGLAYVNVMLLGAFVAWLASERGAHPLLLWPIALALATVTAAGVATDRLVIVAGLIPFGAAGIPLAWHAYRVGRRQLAGAVVTVCAGSVAGAFVVQALMRSERLSATAFPIGVAPIQSLPAHLLLFIQSVFSLFDGYLPGTGATLSAGGNPLGFLCTAAVAFLLLLALVEATTAVRGIEVSRSRRQQVSGGSVDVARRVNTAFWGVGAGVVTFVYVGTTLPVTISTRRYLVTLAYAIVVLGVCRGATSCPRIRFPTLCAVAILLAGGVDGLLERNLSTARSISPTVQMARAVARVVARDHVRVVYAGYWDSYSIGWLAPRFMLIEPVFTYRHRLVAGVGSGAGFAGIIDPHARSDTRGRSLLLLDSKLDAHDGMSAAALSGLGMPVRSTTLVRGRLVAYLYDYDISSRFYRLANAIR